MMMVSVVADDGSRQRRRYDSSSSSIGNGDTRMVTVVQLRWNDGTAEPRFTSVVATEEVHSPSVE
ncbi:hypothetical protein HanXRQr2_Chr08g0334011 [Helianthus annuus]|uniref:Uncharacterized protein n=1 Tax=Helianthus annuus TaxID=4232 RepID=A0A251U5N6_HELAN|nr:hypothetical protein HanXRQr2_Chr08g0334011 [Helianthus annuus]